MTESPSPLGASSTNLEPQVAAMLAYLAWWVTGLVFVLLERESRYVRFHAWQSVIGLGAIWALGSLCWVLSFPVVLMSTAAFRTLMWLGFGVWIAGVVVWVICLLKAYSGERWKMPLAGNLAERWAERAGSTRL